MLKSIPPLLTPDALHALCSMGHGDELAIVDANFPAARVAAAAYAILQTGERRRYGNLLLRKGVVD